MREIELRVNGTRRNEAVEERTLASDFIRHQLGLRGTHVGCEHGVCGACTVRVDGAAVRSCLVLAVQLDGSDLETVEALSGREGLGPLPEAFHRHNALQCGYCTAGIMMSAAELADEHRAIGDEEILEMLGGHICRCTGYVSIFDALREVFE